jgi:hypothetical protein
VGSISGSYKADIDVWDSSLVKQSGLSLARAYGYPASTTIGDYALFGLFYTKGMTIYGKIECFNSLLTKTILDSYQETYRGTAGRVGNYALFMGGTDNINYYNVITCVNSSLVRQSKNLSNTYAVAAGGENSVYCFIGGGHGASGRQTKVEAINSSLTKYACADLSSSTAAMNGAGNKDYWIVAYSDSADVYNTSLTKSNILVPSLGVTLSQLFTAFSNKDKYTFFVDKHNLLIIKNTLICTLYNITDNIGGHFQGSGHGTCLGKYVLGAGDEYYIFVGEIRD